MRHNNNNIRIRRPIRPLPMNPQPKAPRPTAADAAAESDDSIRTAAQWILEGIERGSVDIALVDAFIRTPEEAAADLESETGQQVDHGSTAAALATLKERQLRLRREKFTLLDAMETADEAAYEALRRHLAELNRQIAETEERITQYTLQQKAAN